MELKLFGFIEEVLSALDEMYPMLDEISEEIESFFEKLLAKKNKGYVNINSRVKSKKSLKEKIIRNHYYQKYDTKEILFENVPDIIGLRLECRFIEDETKIYKLIKKIFNEKNEVYPDYYYNSSNPYINLNLKDKQPQEQKNGMKIFRVDGKYLAPNHYVNFELQIKSLVNVFWSEIEHKVIYKNYNYVIEDSFYKDIMKSIKNSLTTIDQQLLLISNQLNEEDYASDMLSQEKQFEAILSKLIYDMFAKRMKDNLGVLVDFRKSCETIVRYVFRDVLNTDWVNYHSNLLLGFNRVRGLDENAIDFRGQLKFEREPNFNTVCSNIIGNHIKEFINEEFQWNLFFRILFVIEPDNNIGDFETFIYYYLDRITNKMTKSKLSTNFTVEETNKIIDALMEQFAKSFVRINNVELLYDNNIEQTIKNINSVIDAIYKNVLTYEQWQKENDIYLDLLVMKMLMLFNIEMNNNKVLSFLERIRETKSSIEMPKGMLKYVYKL